MKKGISLLGATGSIGTQTLDVIRRNKEHFKLVAISVGSNIALARQIITEFQPSLVSVQHKDDYEGLKSEYSIPIHFTYGHEGLIEVSTHTEGDILVNAILGSVGLIPTMQAIYAGKTIALANKETLATAGHLVMAEAQKNNVSILPVDSEHSAIFQCLQGESLKSVERIILTASGGSFRNLSREELKNVTVESALNHPNWSMGAKITIDSATMMNKGLEVIEAHWLFNMPYERIECILHKESTIHSMVEFQGRSIIAQLGTPDMRLPIQYALTYPERLPLDTPRLNLAEMGRLEFKAMDFDRFRCLGLAYEAGKVGGSMPTVLNAANEVAVGKFLNRKISFLDIEAWIEMALENHQPILNPTLDELLDVDIHTREWVNSL